MSDAIDLARVSADGLVLEFPRGFRLCGWLVTALGIAMWTWLFLEWRAVGGLRGMEVSQLLVVKVFSLPFGVGLLIWSTQKIAVAQGRITSRHLGRQRELELSSVRIHKTVPSGVYLKDGNGKKLFVSQFLVGYSELMAGL